MDSEPLYLSDYDWSIKLILGSSSLANMKEPIVKMDFYLGEPGSLPRKVIENFAVELDSKDVSSMIVALENAISD